MVRGPMLVRGSGTRAAGSKLLIVAGLLVIVVLVIAGGYLGWLVRQSQQQHSRDQARSKALQAQVSELTHQLQAAQLTASQGARTPICSPTVPVTSAIQEAVSTAVNSKNTPSLSSYMASSVNVVFAGSEKFGYEPPTAAVADLDYLNKNATSPWDFHLSKATLDTFESGSYKQYFYGTIYPGESHNRYVVVFGFDSCAKINMIFISASADLLTS